MDSNLGGRLSALLALNGNANNSNNKIENEEENEEEKDPAPDAITNEKLKKIVEKSGRIHICFPEAPENIEFEGRTNYPKSYKTLSLKERLLLLFAENFRRQYIEKYPKRKPLILCLPNECGVQKFVSTTIKPCVFLFSELIDNWQGAASFIADHILYEPLEDQINMPNRLLSPETIIQRRKGNSFEMATLLCSLLIGNGFPACVVYGYATREFVNNDQRRVVCPFIPDTDKKTGINVDSIEISNKYALKKPPDLSSNFLLEMEQRRLTEIRKIEEAKEEELKRQIEDLERLPPDEYAARRIHAWVVIVRNAQWSYKPEDRELGSDGERLPQHAFFIEPSTGFRHEVDDPGYTGIECVWNQHNYYINRQEPITDIKNMQWDLSNTKNWEHLLPGEPFECRIEKPLPEDVEALTPDEELSKEKHLDMPVTWVQPFDISLSDFEERYIEGQKTEFYKRTVYERYAPYKKEDGLVKRLTLYETLEYEKPYYRWEWYENRHDLLETIKIDFKTQQIEECYNKGRSDSMKVLIHNSDPLQLKVFRFYHAPRFDALKELHCYNDYIKEFYETRKDLLHFREFKTQNKELVQITEKFQRNHTIPAHRDIAIRRFDLIEQTIFVQFHYDTDCITASTRTFKKLPESEMGEEVQFDPKSTYGYIHPFDKQMTNVELYLMLKQLQSDEEKSIKSYYDRLHEIELNLETIKIQFQKPKLLFTIFDPLRNEAARQLKMQRYEQMKAREELAKTQLADFLAPYIVRLGGGKHTKEEYLRAKNTCLNDFRQYYLDMLNELQRRFEDFNTEEESLKKFMHKFQSQFDDFDYEKFIRDGENITRNKRVIENRIESITEELDRKYKTLKDALDNDKRLSADDGPTQELKLRFTE